MRRSSGAVLIPLLLVMAGCARAVHENLNTNDRDIHAFAMAAHTTEIEEAQLAAARGSTDAVRDFAQVMVREHSAAREADSRIPNIKPENGERGYIYTAGAQPVSNDFMYSALSTPLVQNHDQAMETLGGLSGAAFDRAYLDRQIETHQHILNTINEKLPTVDNDGLRFRLERDRDAVAAHLQKAQQLRAGM